MPLKVNWLVYLLKQKLSFAINASRNIRYLKMQFTSDVSENASLSIAIYMNKPSTVFETSVMISTFIINCVYSHTYIRICRSMYYVGVEDLSDKVLTKLVARWNTVRRKGHSVSNLNVSMSLGRPNHVSLPRSNTGFHELRVVRQNWHLLDYQLSPLTAVCQGNFDCLQPGNGTAQTTITNGKMSNRPFVTGWFVAKREQLDNIWFYKLHVQ